MLRLKSSHAFHSALACHYLKHALLLKVRIKRTSSYLHGHNTILLLEWCTAKCLNIVSALICNLKIVSVCMALPACLPNFLLSIRYVLNWFNFSIDFPFISQLFHSPFVSKLIKPKLAVIMLSQVSANLQLQFAHIHIMHFCVYLFRNFVLCSLSFTEVPLKVQQSYAHI